MYIYIHIPVNIYIYIYLRKLAKYRFWEIFGLLSLIVAPKTFAHLSTWSPSRSWKKIFYGFQNSCFVATVGWSPPWSTGLLKLQCVCVINLFNHWLSSTTQTQDFHIFMIPFQRAEQKNRTLFYLSNFKNFEYRSFS